jgi:hypothetical protein
MTAAQQIQQCIDRSARAKCGRGLYQAEKSCAMALGRTGDARIAADVAAAARRIGAWLGAKAAA